MPQTQPATLTNLGLELMEVNATGQATRANSNWLTINALLHGAVEDKDLTAPPGSPTNEALWIVGPSATGAWAGLDNYIAGRFNSTWYFWLPKAGWQVRVKDENKNYYYTGSAWALVQPSVTTAPTLTRVSKTANFTASLTEAAVYSIDCTSGNVTATLPTAASAANRVFTFKRIDNSGNSVTLDGDGSETIDGSTTRTLPSQWSAVTILSNGTSWEIIGGV